MKDLARLRCECTSNDNDNDNDRISPRSSGKLRLGRWVTKEYRVVRVCEMTDCHLVNCIRYLLRNAPKFLFQALSSNVGGDVKKVAELWGEVEAWVSVIPGVFKDMVSEANDRHLSILMEGDEYRHVTAKALHHLLGESLEGEVCEESEYSGEEIRPGGREMTPEEERRYVHR